MRFLLLVTLMLPLSAPAAGNSTAETYAGPRGLAAVRPAGLPSDSALVAMNAIIGAIVLQRQPIFDTDIPGENNALFRAANAFHKLTRPSTIYSQLLFSSGDPYDPRLLEESERILRGNAFLFDASVIPIAVEDGKVTVEVSTRDVWTLTPILSLSRSGGSSRSRLGIEEENFLGSGATLRLEAERDADRDSTRVIYSDRQLGRKWISLATSYADNDDGNRASFSLWRPFFALDTRWAGGITVLDDQRVESLYDLGEEVVDFRHDQALLHLWYGWSPGLQQGWTRRWRAGVVYDDNAFGPPEDLVRAGPVPVDRKFVYPYIGYELLQDRFYETTNHDSMARTEDFFLGTQVTASLGWADPSFGASRSALIIAGSARRGYGVPAGEMLLLESRFGARLESGSIENGLLRASVRYYRRQSEQRLFFVTFSASISENPDLDKPLQLGGDSGLRGYPLRYQSGDASAVLSIEQRYFTNWYPWRLFRIGAAVFADMGRTWGKNPVGSDSRGLLKDVGVGLRLAPTRASGKIVHIDLAFPLDGDSSIDDVQLNIGSRLGF